jgi:phosphotriesterase-related protein
MHRRQFVGALAASVFAMGLPGCAQVGGGIRGKGSQVMTVAGPIEASALGMTLAHEHLFADLRTYAEQLANPIPLDVDDVIQVVLPYLQEIRRLGCRTVVDCTATTLGRNPALIKRLSQASGLHMLTVTGAYVAAGGRFVPPYVLDETDEELAERWIDEWRHGIGDTGVRPGLIKLGIEGDPLTATERKVLRAGARTHRETGLVIAVHTGPWSEVEPGRNARCAFAQLQLLEDAGVEPSAWIWVHAQNEVQGDYHVRAAGHGAWVSFDGFRPGQEAGYVAMIGRMRDEGHLGRVLVSQDAGWYNAGQPQGGEFKPFLPIFTSLIPALRGSGFDEDQIQTLFVHNPARAFAVRTPERTDG